MQFPNICWCIFKFVTKLFVEKLGWLAIDEVLLPILCPMHVWKMNVSEKSGRLKTGVFVIAIFKFSKALCAPLDQLKESFEKKKKSSIEEWAIWA